MWVLRLLPFPVGIVSWRGPDPRLTAIVKITYSLDRDGRLEPARMQLPLTLQRAGLLSGSGAVHSPSDFAPAKAHADVLISGHAHAPAARTTWPVSIGLGDWTKSATAVADRPTTRILLADDNLHAGAERSALAARELELAEWDGHSLPASFDFARFNVAPSDQQLPELPPGATLTLSGMLASSWTRTVQLPLEEPVVYLVRSAAQPPVAVPMRADTLWIDSDEALCTLCWRGWVRLTEPLPASAQLLVGGSGGPVDYPTLAAAASLPPSRAISEDDLESTDVVTRSAQRKAPGSRTAPIAPAVTGEMDPRALGLSAALPFVPRADSAPTPSAAAAPEPTRAAPAPFMTATLDPSLLLGTALPFARESQPSAPPPSFDEAPVSPASAGATAVFDPATVLGSALPFAASESVAPAVRPPDPLRVERAPVPSPPQSGDAPPVEPEPALSLEAYAAVKARLLDEDTSLAAALLAAAVDERAFRLHERRLRIELAREAAEGRSELATAVREAIATARARLLPADPALGADTDDDIEQAQYVRIRAEIDEAEDPAEALAELGLSAREYATLRRRWTRRCLGDRELAARLEERLRSARAALRRVHSQTGG